ncbi:MAG TPA: EAL domain-containing protein, partial [Pyrinomonadaceae bacterium]|nr:EAL domain-containing protein [Pyrinomonadaceae bacterium]
AIGSHGENSEIVRTVLMLAKSLGMRVTAEGIETDAQLYVLQALGCDYGQGYLIGRPRPAEEIEPLLAVKHKWLPDRLRTVFPTAADDLVDEYDERLPVF